MSTRKDETNANEPGERTGILKRVVIGVAILGALFYLGSGSDGNADMARVQCENYVEQFLKAPSTATHSNNPVITAITDTSWAIKSYTDADNSFGAKVRNNWICNASYDEDTELWHVRLRETS